MQFELDVELSRVLETVERYEFAPATLTARQTRWNAFVRWCAAHELNPLPATPQTVMAYLVDATGASLHPEGTVVLAAKWTGVRDTLPAIRWAHQKAGHPTPTGDRTVRALADVLATAQQPGVKQARPLMLSDIERIGGGPRSHTQFERGWTAVLLGFFGCLRGGEVISIHRDRTTVTPEGLWIFVSRSKGDPFGRGEWVGVARRADQSVCPVAQVERWLSRLGPDEPWLFPSSRRQGAHIGLGTLRSDIINLAAEVLDDTTGLSTHSLRRGFCSSAIESGCSLLSISMKARHKSTSTTLGYIDTAPGAAISVVAEALGS